jgi:hypothetical protein
MLKIYSTLAEFRARVIASYPIKGHTRKIKGKNAYKVVSFPFEGKVEEIKYYDAKKQKCEIVLPPLFDDAGNRIIGQGYDSISGQVVNIIE